MSIDFADVGQRYTRYTRVPVAEYSIEQENSQWRIVFIRRICITVFQERLYILSTLWIWLSLPFIKISIDTGESFIADASFLRLKGTIH